MSAEIDIVKTQNPLIYQRVLDMPEFTFPNRFISRADPLDA